MRRLLAALLLASTAVGQDPGPATPPPPLPRYEIKRATGTITIDGRIDEAAWQNAVTTTLQFPWAAQTGAKQSTTVRLLWDDEFLYASFACDDTDIVAHHLQRDDPTYRDDAVELFLNPSPKQNNYFGLEMNARGVLYDYLYLFPHALVKTHDLRGAKLASHLRGSLNLTSDTDEGWTLEVAIPLVAFAELTRNKPAEAGTEWTANLNRWDGTEPNRRLSVWSDTLQPRPNPHNPVRFGTLVFVK